MDLVALSLAVFSVGAGLVAARAAALSSAWEAAQVPTLTAAPRQHPATPARPAPQAARSQRTLPVLRAVPDLPGTLVARHNPAPVGAELDIELTLVPLVRQTGPPEVAPVQYLAYHEMCTDQIGDQTPFHADSPTEMGVGESASGFASLLGMD